MSIVLTCTVLMSVGSVFGLLSPSDRDRLKQVAEQTNAHSKSTTMDHREQHMMSGGFTCFPFMFQWTLSQVFK